MKRPQRTRVLSKYYGIEYLPQGHKTLINEDDEQLMGLCDISEQRISIRDDLTHDMERHTVFHEHLEALNEDMKIGLEHDQIEQLEVGIMALLRDNPQLVSYLREKKKNGDSKARRRSQPASSGRSDEAQGEHRSGSKGTGDQQNNPK